MRLYWAFYFSVSDSQTASVYWKLLYEGKCKTSVEENFNMHQTRCQNNLHPKTPDFDTNYYMNYNYCICLSSHISDTIYDQMWIAEYHIHTSPNSSNKLTLYAVNLDLRVPNLRQHDNAPGQKASSMNTGFADQFQWWLVNAQKSIRIILAMLFWVGGMLFLCPLSIRETPAHHCHLNVSHILWCEAWEDILSGFMCLKRNMCSTIHRTQQCLNTQDNLK